MFSDKYKKLIMFPLLLLLCVFCIPGCGRKASVDDGKYHVVCTIFPAYDWARNIIGDSDRIELTLLVDNGVDLHSYQPTADDVITIADCDLFVHVGGESDAWVSDVIKESGNKDMKILNMMDILADDIKTEEIIEGMQSNHNHDHEQEHDHDGADEDEEYDEHVWLSIANAVKCSQAFTGVLCELDEENCDLYIRNCNIYVDKLEGEYVKYVRTLSTATYDTILVGDRFPFRYLVNDFDIKYYAAYVGCSAETEASFDTIRFLVNKVDKLDLPAVIVTESDNKALAKTIIENSSDKERAVLVMDSMQSVTAKDIEAGTTYLSVMEDNLAVLERALGCE